jgi:hypothetical protein
MTPSDTNGVDPVCVGRCRATLYDIRLFFCANGPLLKKHHRSKEVAKAYGSRINGVTSSPGKVYASSIENHCKNVHMYRRAHTYAHTYIHYECAYIDGFAVSQVREGEFAFLLFA